MLVDRRSFLQCVGQGVFLIGGLSVLNSCHGLDRYRLFARDQKQQPIGGLTEKEVDILYLASLAPSGHNTQPWTVRIVEPQHWIVGSARERWLPAVDPQNREVLLSIGAFLENLVIAAEAHGYTIDLSVIAKSPSDKELVDIRLRKGQVRDFPLERIKTRRTVRNNFLDREITADDLKYITIHDKRPHLVKVIMPHGFYFPNLSPQGRRLQEGTIEANRKQAFRDPAQEELANWIRWSNKEAEKHRNGLTPDTMEIGGIARLYVEYFYNRKSVLSKSFRETTVDMVSKQVRQCGGWLVITSENSRIQTLIEYGRVFEGMLLRIRERKIAIHPMTQMLEESPARDAIAAELGLAGEVQWILRIGYLGSYPDPVSLRMPLSQLVIT
ncbi:nitroreductase family protein [Chlorobium sp. KB01]|uniref:Acg family FMN-binding oxidoreductase n=1 Tax=Chlorobium sp. KB01 TaxID=1917528 RepID=UPI0009763454|nr:nitroreductase family protein [Chlorobium sp. KB01]